MKLRIASACLERFFGGDGVKCLSAAGWSGVGEELEQEALQALGGRGGKQSGREGGRGQEDTRLYLLENTKSRPAK